METHFSKEQLKDKDNKSSEKILRKCVHCGFCNATCPTYLLLNKFYLLVHLVHHLTIDKLDK